MADPCPCGDPGDCSEPIVQPVAELQPWQRGIADGIAELIERIGPNDRVVLRVGRRRSWLEVIHEETPR